MLELENITKIVAGKNHIKPTSMVLETGHFNVLLGATGSGKTALIKLMAGLDPIGSGRILMAGVDVTKHSPQQRQISLVHQFFINYPHLSVFDNIASPLKVAGLPRSEIEKRVVETADLLKLTSMLYRKPHELSGGQQQRTALARAIAKHAKAVFLDEPLANLDYKLREELRAQLPVLLAGRGTVVVYATSDPEEALLLGGKTALMDDGQVHQFGPTADIYRNPLSMQAAQIFSDPPINYAAIIKRGDKILLDKLTWEAPNSLKSCKDGSYQLAVRPHHISPYKSHDSDIAVTGRIGITELSGSESSAHFSFAGNKWVAQTQGIHPFHLNTDQIFYLDPSACLYFTPAGERIA